MKRYRFTLDAVLRLRRMEEERAKEELRVANNTLRHRIRQRDAEQERYWTITGDTSAATSADLYEERRQHDLAAQRVQLAEVAVTEQATATAIAQLNFRAAAAKVEALNRLDARQRAEYELSERREETKVVDDLVTASYVRATSQPARRVTHV